MDIERTIGELVEIERSHGHRLDGHDKLIASMTEEHRAAIERLDELEKAMAKHQAAIARLERGSAVLLASAREQSRSIRDLADSVSKVTQAQSLLDDLHQRLARSHDELVRALRGLARSQAETDRRHREFIAYVARNVASGDGRKRRPNRPS